MSAPTAREALNRAASLTDEVEAACRTTDDALVFRTARAAFAAIDAARRRARRDHDHLRRTAGAGVARPSGAIPTVEHADRYAARIAECMTRRALAR